MLKQLTMPALKQISWLSPSSNRVRLIAGIVLALLALAALGVGAWSYETANQAAVKYDRERGTLNAQLQSARQLGFVPVHSLAAALEMAHGRGAERIAWLLAPPYFPLVVGETTD